MKNFQKNFINNKEGSEMLKKIAAVFFLMCLSVFSKANKHIIEEGTALQSQIFNKYFNTVSGTRKKGDTNLLNKVYSEVITWLYDRNKQIYENELSRLENSKSAERKTFKPLMLNYNVYVNYNSLFLKEFFSTLLEEKTDYQSYVYTMSYIALENFSINVNTAIEAGKDPSTVDENLKTVINYLHNSSDKRDKEEYMTMSSKELKQSVEEEFINLENAVDKRVKEGGNALRKQGNTVKSNLKKMKKYYDEYDEAFDRYIDSTALDSKSKESIRKLVKFEKISDLKFLMESLETGKGEENVQQ